MIEYSVGNYIYIKKSDVFHDIDLYKGWHKVDKFEKFKIIRITRQGYGKRLELNNIVNNYNVWFNATYLDIFYTEKEYRKIKLEQIKHVINNEL